MRVATLLLVVPLLAPVGLALHDWEPIPRQLAASYGGHGAVWGVLEGLQTNMEFRVYAPAASEYVAGVAFADGNGDLALEFRGYRQDGETYAIVHDGDGSLGAVRVTDARIFTSARWGNFDCDGVVSIGGESGGRFVEFGFHFDEPCDLPAKTRFLAWVAAERPSAWGLEIHAEGPVEIAQERTSTSAIYRAARQFPQEGATAAAGAFHARVEAVSTHARQAFPVAHGFYGAFDGWEIATAGAHATVESDEGVLTCPCPTVALASAPTFAVDGTGVALGWDLLAAGVDVDFPRHGTLG